MIRKVIKPNRDKSCQVYFFLALMAVSVIFISSCSPEAEQTGLFTGTQGLKISVSGFSSEILLPSGIEESTIIPFIASIENMGRHTVGTDDFKLMLSGYDPQLIECSGASNPDLLIRECEVTLNHGRTIEGRNTLRRIGDKVIITNDMFDFKTSPEGIPGDMYRFELLFSMCYRYKTYFSDSLMLDPNSDFQKIDYRGQASMRTHTGGQGAPLAVTGISSIATGNKAIVFVNVKKMDNVQVYFDEEKPPAIQKCGSASYNIRDRFKVTMAQLSDFTELSLCNGKTFYLNDMGEGQFTCEFELGRDIRNEISSIFNLELEYDVFDYTKQPFSMRKI